MKKKSKFLMAVSIPFLTNTMQEDKPLGSLHTDALPQVTFFNTFSENAHLYIIEREYGQRSYCLDLTQCNVTSLKDLYLLRKKCQNPISSIDLSNNRVKKINLSKFLELFPLLQELKVNNSGVQKLSIKKLPTNFNLELINNDLKEIEIFKVYEGASCNFEHNNHLSAQAKKNIKTSFKRPWIERFALLDQSLPILQDIKKIRAFFFFGIVLLYTTHNVGDYIDKVIIGRGAMAFCFLSMISYFLIANYYENYHTITYKGAFKY